MADSIQTPTARRLFFLDIILLLLVLYIHSTAYLFTTEPLKRRKRRAISFLDLPSEVRNNIYKLVASETTPSTITLSYGCDCRYWQDLWRKYFGLAHYLVQGHYLGCPHFSPISEAALVLLAHCCRGMYVECMPLYLRSTSVNLEHAPRLLSTFFRTNVEFENRRLNVVLTFAGIETSPDLLRLLLFYNTTQSFRLRFEIADRTYLSFANHMQAVANHNDPTWTNDLKNNIKHIRVTYLGLYTNLRLHVVIDTPLSDIKPCLEIVFKRDKAPASIQAEVDNLMPGDIGNRVGVSGAAYRAQAGLDNLVPNLQADEQFGFQFKVEGSNEWQSPRKIARR